MGSERKPVIYAKGLYKIYRVGETQVRALNGVDLSSIRGNSVPSWGPPVPVNPLF